MRAIGFILKLLLKILVAPVILALTLFVWLCGAGISLRPGVGAYQHGDRPAGRGGPADLFPAKWHYPAGDGISYQSVWSSNGCYLAAG